MSKKKTSKKGNYEEMLEPIIYDRKLSPSDLRNYIDISLTKVALSDYEWLKYTLFVEMTTKDYGELKIKFEYMGTTYSDMEVETEDRKYSYLFNSDLFEEHIIRFLRKHIRSWRKEHSFSRTEEVVDFYNDVLTSPKTKYEGSQMKRKY